MGFYRRLIKEKNTVMSQRDPRSILIAVEGIDGTGKSSAVPVIEEVCKRCGYDTLTTREPYTQEVIDLVHSSQKGNLLPLF